jgi:hypothetical protein
VNGEASLYHRPHIPCRDAPESPLHHGRTRRPLPQTPTADVTLELSQTGAPDYYLPRCLWETCAQVRQASWIAGRLSHVGTFETC